MPKSVSVTLAVVDRMVELVQELDRACTPPPLPPVKKRDRKRWRCAMTEAKADRAAAFRRAQAGAIHCPGRPVRETQAETRARRKRAGRQVLENAESKYRRTDPALWAETQERSKKAKALAAELADSFVWHGPALDRLSGWGKERAGWYDYAAAPGIRSGLRAAVVKDLARIRLKLEDAAGVAAQNREVLSALLAQVGRSGSSSASGENSEGEAQGGVGESPGGEEQDDKLPPSRLRAKAAYDYAMTNITGADKMTVAELFDALRGRLDAEICKAAGKQAEQLQEFKDSLPDNAETFGRYLREAGVKKYDKTGQRRLRTRSIRRQSEI